MDKTEPRCGIPKMSDRQVLLEAVAMRMREVARLSIHYGETMAARLGINSTDLECLDLVAIGDHVTAGALAEKTGLTTGAITTAIDRLERGGFVERRRDESDRRKVVVVESSAMRRRAEPIGAPMRNVINDVLARYEDEQLKFLNRVLGELCEAAKQITASLLSDDRPARRRAAKKSGRRPRSSRVRT